MQRLRIGLGLLGLVLGALIIWAIAVGNFRVEGAWLTSNPWGIVSLADLYLGFLISATIICLIEKPFYAMLWIIPLPVLGNVWTVVWLIYRLPVLRQRLQVQQR